MFVYLVTTVEEFPKYKIGRSKNPNSRIKQLQTANGVELELLNAVPSKYPSILEKQLHRHFNKCIFINEWFDLSVDDVKNFTDTCAKMEETLKAMSSNPFWCKKYKLNES